MLGKSSVRDICVVVVQRRWMMTCEGGGDRADSAACAGQEMMFAGVWWLVLPSVVLYVYST